MSLTRSMLKGMGLTDEQVSAIIDEHVAVVDGLKADRDSYKEKAQKVDKLEKELADAKSGDEDWKAKYEAEHDAFDKFKKDVEGKENTAKLKSAYEKLLKDAKVGESHIASILKVTDFSGMKLDKEGKLVDEDKISDSIKNDWSGFITSTGEKGASVETPPKGNGSGKTKEEIMKIKDTSERQKAIAENIDLFV